MMDYEIASPPSGARNDGLRAAPHNVPLDRIVMMEDHDKAYEAWRERGVRAMTLIHVDAHIDFGWVPDTDLDEIRSVREASLVNPFFKSRRRMMTIGNYIYPAMRDGMVGRFYWVVPDESWRRAAGRRAIMRHLRRITALKSRAGRAIERRGDSIRCRVMDRELIVCPLETLPAISERALLDIDVDFMVTPRIWDDLAPERAPWISPDELYRKLAARVTSPAIVTISYSVEGGFTPLRYRHLGDILACRFGREIPAHTLKAADEFNRCLHELRKDAADPAAAGKHYREAVRLDPAYKTAYNNYGILYLLNGQLARAKAEFERFLALDPENAAALDGLGHIALSRGQYACAEGYFDRVMAREARHTSARLGKGIALARRARLDEAAGIFRAIAQERPDDPEAHRWLAWIAERRTDAPGATRHYQDAVMRGLENAGIHFRLARLYLKRGMWLRVFEELQRAVALCKL